MVTQNRCEPDLFKDALKPTPVSYLTFFFKKYLISLTCASDSWVTIWYKYQGKITLCLFWSHSTGSLTLDIRKARKTGGGRNAMKPFGCFPKLNLIFLTWTLNTNVVPWRVYTYIHSCTGLPCRWGWHPSRDRGRPGPRQPPAATATPSFTTQSI